MAKPGFLKFQAPSGETVERPQEELQTLRRAGFKPLSGQTVSLGPSKEEQIPIEVVMRRPATQDLPIESQSLAFKGAAEREYGGLGGAAKALALGASQGFTSYFAAPTAMAAGAVKPETVEMIRTAQPVASTIGEIGGSLGQIAALSALAGPAGAAAGGAEALGTIGRAAQAYRGLSPARQALARAAAFGVPTGVGSELTEAAVAGREARPLEGAAVGLGAGLAGEAVVGALGKAYPVVQKGIAAVRGAMAEGETLAAAKKALSAAKTVEQRAAAEARVAAAQERAAAKEAGKSAVDEGAVQAGEEAQWSLANFRMAAENRVQSSQTRIGDAIKRLSDYDAQAAARGIPARPDAALGKLRSRLGSNAERLQSLSSKIESEASLSNEISTLLEAQNDVTSLVGAASANKQKAADEMIRLKTVMDEVTAGAKKGASLSKLQSQMELAQRRFEEYGMLETAARDVIDSSIDAMAAKEANASVLKAVGATSRELDKQTSLLNKAREKATQAALDQESAKSAQEVISEAETLANKMGVGKTVEGFEPKTVVSYTRGASADNPRINEADIKTVLSEAAQAGKVRSVIGALLRGEMQLPFANGTLGAAKATHTKIAKILQKNDAIVASLPLADRIGVAKMLFDNIKGNNASTIAGNVAERLLGAKSLSKNPSVLAAEKRGAGFIAEAPIAPVVPAAAPAVEAAAVPQLTPEQAVAQRTAEATEAFNQKARGQIDAINALQNESKNLEAVAKWAQTSLREAETTLAQRRAATGQIRNQAAQDAASLKYTQAAIAKDQASQAFEATSALKAEIADAQARLTSSATSADEAKATIAQIKEQVRQLRATAQSAQKIETLRTAKKATEGEIARDMGLMSFVEANRSKIDDAVTILRAAEEQYPSLLKKSKFGGFVTPGQEDLLQSELSRFYKTEEGKRVADAIAKAAKAAESQTAREAAAAASGEASKSMRDVATEALKSPAVWASTAAGGPSAGLAALVGVLASSSPRGSMRKIISALTPQIMVNATLGAADAIFQPTALKLVGTRMAVQKGMEVSRADVEKTKNEVDELVADQELARQVFKDSARRVAFPQEMYDEIEQKYLKAVGELQKKRPATFGKGPVSAEEEAFVQSFRVLSDPDTVRTALQSGRLSKAQADMLQAVAPEAYRSVQSALQDVQENSPKPVQSPLMARFRVSASGRGAMSVAAVQSLLSAVSQGQQQQNQIIPGGGNGLRTASPPPSGKSILTQEK